ncbi:MAG: hypothetical protein KME07_10525 [Pegethrix bostrychoides GSE-TBD4-15B]|jgi:hypothetical protein|uniref:Uncharacterized protein n=1 Tax=Pegethrix bostrychoides GSE-TBD4-15B TaxID=2839662 RepID=A0A951U5T9_9CYAN|nr:hypothetical protein [Pegethrix bostrychoides GSE-TBD4-15B]
MEFWEFLIQKEGDRSWLPLESPSAEILAGRYRIVARSSRPSTAAEICVTHYDAQETPPVRRVRKRSSHTNPDGLIVIMPFTQLQPGLWELSATSDLMAEMLGESWQYAMRLEVLSEAPDIADDWEPDRSDDFAAEMAAEMAAGRTDPVNALIEQSTEQLTEQPTEQPAPAPEPALASQAAAAGELVELSAEPVAEPAMAIAQTVTQTEDDFELAEFDELADEPGPLDQPQVAANLPALQVILEREVFVIQRGESLSLTGRVEFPAEYPSDWQPAISELRVRLYDPQTSQMLMDEVYPIDNRIPPFPFSGTVSLPEHYQTYLVLGELMLQGMTPSGQPQILAQRSFNVTTDLHELIESVANDFPDPTLLPSEAQMPAPEPIPPAELNRIAASFQRSPQQPLPPQLRPHSQPQNPTRTHASLDLPSFTSVQAVAPVAPKEPVSADLANPAARPAPASEPIEPTEISTSAADLLLEPATAPQPEPQLASQSEFQPESQPEFQPESQPQLQPAELFSDWSELENRLPLWRQPLTRPAPASSKPEDASFRALNIQGRFWSRLQVLAANPELSAELADEEFSALTAPEARQRGRDANLTLHEVVVDDETSAQASGEQATVPNPPSAEAEPPVDFLSEFVLPDNEPIPTPRLQIPQGDLVAGQPISLTVKLPNLKARVYVKLWLRDRQTRSMLGAARWLIDFLPDGFGNQMARTEVIVPPGYLKVQFEAIAVEIATQRESDKVTTTRPIMPPDLSPLSLDRLEL